MATAWRTRRSIVQKYLPASVDSENYGHYEDQKEIDL
jgi:hypothetical protein